MLLGRGGGEWGGYNWFISENFDFSKLEEFLAEHRNCRTKRNAFWGALYRLVESEHS
jgi:hypothetical protein